MPNALSHRHWRKLRALVLAMSDTCWLCGQRGADEVDHVKERSKGGAVYDLANLRPAHGRKQYDAQGRMTCQGNRGRSNRKKPERMSW